MSIKSPLSCVKRKNFTAAYTRFSCPQMEIKKYIGTSISSHAK